MYLRKFCESIRALVVAGMIAAIAIPAPLALAAGDDAKDAKNDTGTSADKTAADAAKKTDPQPPADSTAAATVAVDASDSGTGVVTQNQPQQSGQTQITQPLALSPEVPHQRVGVNMDQKLLLPMQDAITMALQRNLDIEVFRQSVQISQSALLASRGVYDLASTSFIGYRSAISPTSSSFIEGGSSGSISNNSLTFNFSSFKEVERTGGRWQVQFNNSRATTSSTRQDFTTRYSPALSFNYTQPILRDLSFDQNRRSVQLAKKQLDLSDSAFRQRVIEIINAVQTAYWDLVFSIRNEAIARESVELARTQLDNNRKMVEAGTLAPIELRSTEAALESRKGDVILAL